MYRYLLFAFLLDWGFCFSQANDILHEISNAGAKWLTVRGGSDLINDTYGLTLSNGYDEFPLIHFEDFRDDIAFKVRGQTDFEEDYLLEANVAWVHPFKYIKEISVEYVQSKYPNKGFFYNDISISARRWVKRLRSDLIIKLGRQTINNDSNIGAALGWQKVLLPRLLYSGFSLGYYNGYLAYSIYSQGFVHEKNISFRVAFESVKNFNTLNFGVGFTFKRGEDMFD